MERYVTAAAATILTEQTDDAWVDEKLDKKLAW
jgi:hypothetical protein